MMSMDRIQDAVEVGKRNLEAMKLIRNWCAHVTVRKHGGTGLIEMQTGLPIGHHFLECPHAPAGGMAAWDLGDTAVDFYDRNCVGCKHRQPVGLPNISKLVAERDARKKLREQEQARENQEREAKLAARESVRQDLRRTLDPLSATTLDQISELDRTRTDQAAERLVQLSELAPETFRPEIIEHLFSQIAAGEYWLFDAALKILRNLQADPTRLCNAALQVLRSYSGREVAAEIVEKNAALAKDDLIAPALPSLPSSVPV